MGWYWFCCCELAPVTFLMEGGSVCLMLFVVGSTNQSLRWAGCA